MTVKPVFALKSILVTPKFIRSKVASPWTWGFPPCTIFSEEQRAHTMNGSCSFGEQCWAQIHGFRSTWILGVWPEASHSSSLSLSFLLYQMDMTTPPSQSTVCPQWDNTCRALGQDNFKHTIKTSQFSALSSSCPLWREPQIQGEKDESRWLGSWEGAEISGLWF